MTRYFIFCALLISQLVHARQKPNILFLMADDFSYPYSGVYGHPLVKTPNMDLLAKNGVTFTNAYAAAPSCTPSRAGILTGMYPHQLGEGVNLVGRLDRNIPTFVSILRNEGYFVGFERKGWGPGDFKQMGYQENPAGTEIAFKQLLEQTPPDQPFFFWFGTNDPHRFFPFGAGSRNGMDPGKIQVPGFLPDAPEIRSDLADYFFLIQRFDREIGELLELLRKTGRLENTIIVLSSDNGMPFPRAKANLYDHGTRVPLIISHFGKTFQQGVTHHSFVNLIDLMPTFLEMSGLQQLPKVSGKSLVPVMQGLQQEHRSEVFLERERHCLARVDSGMLAGYPMRAVRNRQYLYIRNFRPHRSPGGDASIPGTPSVFGDVDGGPSKALLMDNRTDKRVEYYFNLAFGLRPAEELYDVQKDPYQLNNLAIHPAYAAVCQSMRTQLDAWMQQEQDPRRNGGGDEIDRYRATTTAWITQWGIIFEKQ